MMPMDSKKLINRFSWKRSLSAVFSQLHKIHFADTWLVSAYTVMTNSTATICGCSEVLSLHLLPGQDK